MAGRHQESQNDRITKLEKQVQKIQAKLSASEDENREMRGTIMLGHLSYRLSHILEHFVYGPEGSGEFVPMRIKDIVKRVDQLDGLQRARWERVVQEMAQVMPLEEVIRVDNYLRYLRRPSAHGTHQEGKSATLADFKMWAQQHCKVQAIESVKTFALLLNKFAPDNKPLRASVTRVKEVIGGN
jgi:hypothetical protein